MKKAIFVSLLVLLSSCAVQVQEQAEDTNPTATETFISTDEVPAETPEPMVIATATLKPTDTTKETPVPTPTPTKMVMLEPGTYRRFYAVSETILPLFIQYGPIYGEDSVWFQTQEGNEYTIKYNFENEKLYVNNICIASDPEAIVFLNFPRSINSEESEVYIIGYLPILGYLVDLHMQEYEDDKTKIPLIAPIICISEESWEVNCSSLHSPMYWTQTIPNGV